MKNLKRALAVLVVVTMMISTVAFASFSDVTGTSNVANAVNVGVGLNLFKGYEDGTFKPEGDITRAEFAAIVVRMLGQEAQADGAKGATSFTDVKADNWAAGYINIVTRLGIVNGYGDGNFGPEDKVTYEQAIKMIIVALGYTPAIGSAGYPVGYLTKAGELGITSGVAGANGVPANRGTVAQLVFNALDVPIMTQNGYGTDISFVINDGVGTDAVRKTIMSEYLDVVKLQVYVDMYKGNDKSTNNNNDIEVNILKNYNSKYKNDFPVSKTTPVTLDAGTSAISGLVGSNAIIYVSYDSNLSVSDSVVVFAMKDTTKLDEVSMKDDAIDSYDSAKNQLNYYVNPTDSKTDDITISNDKVSIYVNDVKTDYTTTASIDSAVASVLVDANGKSMFYGDVTFTSTDGGSTYDKIFVTNYTNFVVDYVNKNTKKVISKNGATAITFDPEKTEFKSTLVDSKGTALKFEDLKEWDVLTCVVTKGSTLKTVTKATLVNNKVTGKVTEIGGDNNDEYTIDGKVYKADKTSLNASAKTINLSDEGTYYLDARGYIVYFDKTASVSNNYAYIVAMDENTGLTKGLQFKLFTAKGETIIVNTASTVKVDGISVKEAEFKNFTSATATDPAKCEVVLTTPVSSTTSLTNENGAIYTLDTNSKIAGFSGNKALKEGDFITYAVNASNQITTIDRPHTDTGLSLTAAKDIFASYGTANAAKYDSSNNSITVTVNPTTTYRGYVTDKTVIMVAPTPNGIPTSNEDKYTLFDVKSIVDGQEFTIAQLFDVDDLNNDIGVLLVTSDVTAKDATGVATIVSSSTSTNVDGDTISKFTVLKDGAEVALLADREITGPTQGTVVVPVKNVKGEVTSFNTLASIDGNVLAAASKGTTSGEVIDQDTKYYKGNVQRISSMSVEFTDGKSILVRGDTNVYIYDERVGSTRKVSIGDISEVDVRAARTSDLVEGSNPPVYESYVKHVTGSGATLKGVVYNDGADDIVNVSLFAREFEGKIVDVVLYIFK